MHRQGEVTDCGRYLIVTAGRDCEYNMVFYCDLQSLPNGTVSEKLPLTPVVDKLEADYEVKYRKLVVLHFVSCHLHLFATHGLTVIFFCQYIANAGSKIVFRTNKDAPNYRLIEIDFNAPEPQNWKTLIEEDKSDVLDWAVCVNKDKLVVCYMHDVKVIPYS